ncbi:hypothetical protein LTR95_004706 [Oleoguttula sp. CCFEE 5521]
MARSFRLPIHRTVLHSRRRYTTPPKTYFQPLDQPPTPPPRTSFRILRWSLFGVTAFGIGFYMHAYLSARFGLDVLEELAGEMDPQDAMAMQGALQDGVEVAQARVVHAFTHEQATAVLRQRAGVAVTPTVVSHVCQSPSNLPCEDTWSSGTYMYLKDPAKDWSEWAIFDGHAGTRTSQALKEILPVVVGEKLWESGCMQRMYVANDQRVWRVIQNAFKYLDEEVLGEAKRCLEDDQDGLRPAEKVSLLSNMLSGSCALLALFDPTKGVLRVANTGDSRAVLGTWEDGKYVARPMSEDHTGFNQKEVERLAAAHPGEDVIDPKTGRIFGLAVTRAFGDSRWKWSQELTAKAHELFWGPAPRPNNVVKTAPYLTAEPEIQEVRVQTGAHPDFLIMASDGLWDNMSNDDAVACVQLWLEHNKPLDIVRRLKTDMEELKNGPAITAKKAGTASGNAKSRLPFSFSSHSSPSTDGLEPPSMPDSTPDADPDTYYDPDQRALKWRVSPKHFIVEDDNAGVHLIKNAFGGSRRRLFESVMTVQPPLSRDVRDDVTVHVIFFGVDAKAEAKEMEQAGGRE